MKKVLFAVLALATMASCSNEYTVEMDREAIAFGDTFVDNATKAEYTAVNGIAEFKVYGTVTGSGNTVLIFDGDTVTRPSDVTGAWICTETQYWVPGTEYEFAAIVDGGNSDVIAMPTTIDFTVTDGTVDLLYAEANVSVDADGVKSGDLKNDMVAFTFDHLLSKVQFTVKNGMTADYTFKVTDISVTGIKDKGVYTIAGETWDLAVGAADLATALSFGTTEEIPVNNGAKVASTTRLILPVEQTLAVTINYDIYCKGQKVASTSKTGTVPTTTYAAKTLYNVATTLSLTDQIEFTVNSVGGFSNADINF